MIPNTTTAGRLDERNIFNQVYNFAIVNTDAVYCDLFPKQIDYRQITIQVYSQMRK